MTQGLPLSPSSDRILRAWQGILSKVIETQTHNTKLSLVAGLNGEKWIDNRPIFRKVVKVGALPNTTLKTIAHEIGDYTNIIRLWGTAKDEATGITIPLPYIKADLVEFVELSVSQGLIQLSSTADYSAYDGYVTLEYIR